MEEIKKILTRMQERLDRFELEINHGQKKFLNLAQAAIYLSVSESHLYKLTSTKRIPHYSPGGKLLYFCKDELDQWLQSNKRLTIDEIEEKAKSNLNKQNFSN